MAYAAPDIAAIAQAVRTGMPVAGFTVGGEEVLPSDTVRMEALERRCLEQRDYATLRQLNRARLAFDIQERRTRMRALPVHIQLEHTTFCNARCIMCDHALAGNRGSRHLDPALLVQLEPLFAYAELVVMHGNGEPLLHPDVRGFLARYRTWGLRVSLNTNLSVLDAELARALENTCTSLHVSCDGADAATYEAIRRGLSFTRLVENLELLARLAPSVPKTLDVVAMRQNVLDLPAFVDFAAAHGFAKVVFSPLGASGALGNASDAPDCFWDIACHQGLFAQERGRVLGVQVVGFWGEGPVGQPSATFVPPSADRLAEFARTARTYRTDADWGALRRANPHFTNDLACGVLSAADARPDGAGPVADPAFAGVCEYPFGKTYVDLQGNVCICCTAQRQVVGALSEDRSFADIWNGERYQQVRRTFYEGRLPRFCAKCAFVSQHALAFMA